MQTPTMDQVGGRIRPSPAERLSFDPLTLIFEQCAKIDWKAPIRISAVSTKWRRAVLKTPRAWRFLDATSEAGLAQLTLFCARSGENNWLHIRLTSGHIHLVPGPLADKLECVTIDTFPTAVRPISFPNVTRLHVNSGGWYLDLANITIASFPGLRHFKTNEVVTDMGKDISGYLMPPLHTLKLGVDYSSNLPWLQLIRSCQSSLVSLSLVIPCREYHLYHHPAIVLELPKLQYLQVTTARNPERATVFHTPRLTTYIQVDFVGFKRSLVHEDLRSVTHMRTGAVPVLSTMPELRILQLEISPGDGQKIVDELHDDPIICQRLETIGFIFFGGCRSLLIYELQRKMEKRRPHLALYCVEKWDDELADVEVDSCNEYSLCRNLWAETSPDGYPE